MQINYDLFGLRLLTNFDLPCLKPVEKNDTKPDITIYFESTPDDLCETISRELFYDVPDVEGNRPYLEIFKVLNGKYYQLKYNFGIEFILDKSGSHAWCNWVSPGSKDHVILHLIGPVIGFMLRLRGIVCLHACGIISGNGAFAITGASGSGKSTLAAAFACQGMRILTDDIMPMKLHDNNINAVSGYPRLSLFTDSCKYLNCIPDNLPKIVEDIDKGYFNLHVQPNMFFSEDIALKAIYILDWSYNNYHDNEITTLSPAKAVSMLAANTIRNELLDETMRKKEFIFLCHLVDKIPVKLLKPLDDIKQINILTKTILDDYHSINI